MKSLKKPVCISLNDAQVQRLDARAAQTGMNRSQQIQRDLTAYWAMLDDGLTQAQSHFSRADVECLAQIFRGKVLVPSDDVLWTRGKFAQYVLKAKKYGDAERVERIAKILRYRADRFEMFALLDWLRRASIAPDSPDLYDGWSLD